ncbi:hypothetical protein [Terrisporobacter othiniensis]|uniref:hypothetical protein n=1 Tax=Terrisporobacter othiniensis TaxID=1577792 RepID=UPI0038CD8FC2
MDGCGCVCGTLSATNISIGLLFSRSEGNDSSINKAKELSKNIHDIFIEKIVLYVVSKLQRD